MIYPGLTSHPQHELAKRQMKGFGGMISILTGSKDKAAKILSRVKVFSLAESLGGVESLISHPATMTHASVPAEHRKELGIIDDLFRLSCGVEDVEDRWPTWSTLSDEASHELPDRNERTMTLRASCKSATSGQ